MKRIFSILKGINFSKRFFMAMTILIISFITGFFFPFIFSISKLVLLLVLLTTVIDFIMLFSISSGIDANRIMDERLSNGDDNEIEIVVANNYYFSINANIIDEIPPQLQVRDFLMKFFIKERVQGTFKYTIRPVERGEYKFGRINIFVTGPIALLERRFIFNEEKTVSVYPSIIQMKKFDIFAISNRLQEVGIKRIRRIGDSMEFEQIKKYTQGDDFRKINWKASARRRELMMNHFEDERSQNLYNIIDMGRVMKMPFNGMTLLDYAINSALVLSNIAIRKGDKSGLVTFSNEIDTFLKPDRRYSQMERILEKLYRCNTGFLESNYEQLYSMLTVRQRQRSLIFLYTNFESLSSLNRNIRYLSMIAKRHFLVVVFFENTELGEITQNDPDNLESLYIKTIAEKFIFEKKQIIKELDRHGINSLFTTTGRLTVDSINRYLELKSRRL